MLQLLSVCHCASYAFVQLGHMSLGACVCIKPCMHATRNCCYYMSRWMHAWMGGWVDGRATDRQRNGPMYMCLCKQTHTHTYTHIRRDSQAGRQAETDKDRQRQRGRDTHTQKDRQAGRQASCITCIQRHRRRDRDRQTHNRHINKHLCRSRAITRTPISASVSNVSWNLRLLPYSTRRHAFREKLLCLG